MTEALERLSTVLTTAPPDQAVATIITGTVIATYPAVRVDSGSLQLLCTSTAPVAVGDIVYVLQQGATNIVIGRVTPKGLQFVYRGLSLSPTAMTIGVTSVDTGIVSYVPTFTGWVEFAVSVWMGNDSAAATYNQLLFSNSAASPNGVAYQVTSASAATSGAGNYNILPQTTLYYPCASGVDIAPTWRLNQPATGTNYRSGIAMVKVYAS